MAKVCVAFLSFFWEHLSFVRIFFFFFFLRTFNCIWSLFEFRSISEIRISFVSSFVETFLSIIFAPSIKDFEQVAQIFLPK